MSVNFKKTTVKLTKDPSGTPANDINAIDDDELKKMAQKVQLVLAEKGLAGLRCEVEIDVDHSGSMYLDYENKKQVKLIKWALAFALVVDGDGKVPVRKWDHRLHPQQEATEKNYLEVAEGLWNKNDMGSTKMSTVIKDATNTARNGKALLVKVIIGDGDPDYDDETATFNAAMESASAPVWIKMLTLKPVPFMQKIDDAKSKKDAGLLGIGAKRLIDNFDTKAVDPSDPSVTYLTFARDMLDELDTYIADATTEGVLT